MEDLIQLGSTAFILLVTYFIGGKVESNHFKSIRNRERASRRMMVLTIQNIPPEWQPQDSGLVTGSVVVSLDYFKRFLAGIRAIFGGRIKSYEPLLDRARREAILRMKEEALAKGYTSVINLRLDTSRLASATKDGKSTAGVEILAFGTGLKLSK
jgi:uncharacterized protein YbjQ (UPF0145 family)